MFNLDYFRSEYMPEQRTL